MYLEIALATDKLFSKISLSELMWLYCLGFYLQVNLISANKLIEIQDKQNSF